MAQILTTTTETSQNYLALNLFPKKGKDMGKDSNLLREWLWGNQKLYPGTTSDPYSAITLLLVMFTLR